MTDAIDTDTPPSLYYSPSVSDHDHLSTSDSSTPVSTPVGFGATSSYPRKPSSQRQFSFARDSPSISNLADSKNSNHPLFVDTPLAESAVPGKDLADLSSFPLLPSSSQTDRKSSYTMNAQPSPFDLSTRQTSVSPPGQQASNLTSALQKAASNERGGNFPAPVASNASAAYKTAAARKDSLGASMSQWGNGTKPISVMGSNREKPRRESLAGSLVGGMSWGGISVGSWIRDESVFIPPPRSIFRA